MSDIIKRLVAICEDGHKRGCDGRNYQCTCGFEDEEIKTCTDAAAEITLLTEENKRMREALQLVRLSGCWLCLSEETKAIIIDRLDVERSS